MIHSFQPMILRFLSGIVCSESFQNCFCFICKFLFSNILHYVTEPKNQVKSYTSQMKLNISYPEPDESTGNNQLIQQLIYVKKSVR